MRSNQEDYSLSTLFSPLIEHEDSTTLPSECYSVTAMAVLNGHFVCVNSPSRRWLIYVCVHSSPKETQL